MTGPWSRSFFVRLVIAVLVATPAAVAAKPRVVAHNDGTWNWRHHEPSPSQFRRAERVAPPLPAPSPRQPTTGEVENLYRNLMRSEGVPAK